jgi:hypothetical protein
MSGDGPMRRNHTQDKRAFYDRARQYRFPIAPATGDDATEGSVQSCESRK